MSKLRIIVLAGLLQGATCMAQIQPPGGPIPRANPSQGGFPPGLYVQVLDGLIHVTNAGGTQNFAAGQFGYTPGITQPPVVVPKNPGLVFTPPPVFSSSTQPGSTATGATKSNTVDCEVR